MKTNESMQLCTKHEPFYFGENEICCHCGSRLLYGESIERFGPCLDPSHSKGISATIGGVTSWQCSCGRTWETK